RIDFSPTSWRWANGRMRNAEGGTRNRRGRFDTPRWPPCAPPAQPVPRSAFRVPRFLVGVALLLAACQGDGRPPLVIYSPHGRGPGDRYAAAYETPVVIVYAEQAIRPDEAPQDWDDLLDARWKGKILIRDPLASGTMRAVWGMIIERGSKQTGDTAAGFRWLARLDAQTKEYVLNGPLLDQKIVRQEGLVTIWDLPDILLNRRDGLQLGYGFPKSGTPVIEDAIAVVRGARHGAAARAFVEWVGSVDAQLLAAREVYRLPARLDIPADSLPAWAREVRRRMQVADVDWDLLARRGPEWMRHWDEAVRGRGAVAR